MTKKSNKTIINSIQGFLLLVLRIVFAYVEFVLNAIKPAHRKDIKGQNVLITGSGHGLGRELAHKFAQNGANLVLVDINEGNNEAVKREILDNYCDSSKLRVASYSMDIRDEAKVAQLAQRVQKEFGDIDILVNNAGIVQCLPFFELSPALVERTFQVNILAHVWTIKHFLPAMIKNQRGHVVGISSIAGLIGGKYLTDYCSSKFAVVGLMDSLDREIHDQGANENVYFTTVCPSCISTGMFQTFTTKFSWLLPVLTAEKVAASILDATLTNKKLVAIPPITLFFHRLSSIIPAKVINLVQDYLDYGVKPHCK